MFPQDTSEFLSSLKVNKPLVSTERESSDFHNEVGAFHLEMNNCWLKPAFTQSHYELHDSNFSDAPCNVTPFYCEESVSPTEESTKNNLDKEEISLISKSTESIKQEPYLNFPASEKRSFIDPVVHDYLNPASGYLKLTVKTIQSGSGSKAFSGFFILYDSQRKCAITEPLHISGKQDHAVFTQAGLEISTAYLPLVKCTPFITLICFLATDSSLCPGNYEPYATTSIPLFTDKQTLLPEISIPKQWSLAISQNYDELFYLVSINSESLKSNIPIHLNLDIEMVNKVSNIYHTFNTFHNDSLIASSLPYQSSYPAPVITISSASAHLKSHLPKETVRAKFYLCNDIPKDFLLPNPIPGIFHTRTQERSNSFTTEIVMPNTDISWPSIIQIQIDNQLKQSTYLLVHLIAGDSIIYVGILNLFDNGNPIMSGVEKIPIYPPKNIPKDCFKKPTKSSFSKGSMQFTINLPSMFIPSSNLKSIIDAHLPEQILPPIYSDLLLQEYESQLIPITAKFLSMAASNTIRHLITFLGKCEPGHHEEILFSWIDNILDPIGINPDLVDILCKEITDMINDAKLESADYQQAFHQDLSYSLQFILRIITVAISAGAKFDSELMREFLNQIPRIIMKSVPLRYADASSSYSSPSKRGESPSIGGIDQQIIEKSLSRPIALTSRFTALLLTLMPHVDFIPAIIMEHLNTFTRTRSTNKSSLRYLAIRFVCGFCETPHFIVSLAMQVKDIKDTPNYSAYVPVLSQIYSLCYSIIISPDADIESIKLWVSFFSRIVSHAEQFPPALCLKTAYLLFPFLNTVITHFNDKFFIKHPSLRKEFIPIAIFIISHAPKNLIKLYFNSLGASFQNIFFTFLCSVVELSTSLIKSDNPSYDRPSQVMVYFNNLTKVILGFMLNVMDVIANVPAAVALLDQLFNKYQPVDNVNIFYTVVSKLIDSYPCDRELVKWVLRLLTFRQHRMRCLGAALMIKVIEADFARNKSINSASVEMMDALTEILLNISVEEIQIFKLLITRIKDICLSTSQNPAFKQELTERMENTRVIIITVEDQKKSSYPPEEKCIHIMRIADQYKQFPSVRLKWLRELVKTNLESNNKVSGFVSQLHVAALIAAVTEAKRGKEAVKLPDIHKNICQPIGTLSTSSKYDFALWPSVLVETQMPAKLDQTLLSDFTTDLLVQALEEAISLGQSAGLFYSLRPLFSLKMRIAQSARDSSSLCETSKSLSSNLSKVMIKDSTTVDFPMAFFLVIDKQAKSNDLQMRVFCNSPISLDDFVEKMNQNGRFEGRKAVPWTDVTKECQDVAVIKLHRVNQDENAGEYPHSWREFTSDVRFTGDDEMINILYCETRDPLPHYCAASTVTKCAIKKLTAPEYIGQFVKISCEFLSRTADEFAIWFPYQYAGSHSDEVVFVPDLYRIRSAIQHVVMGNDSTGDWLVSLKKKFPDEAKEYAQKILVQIKRLQSVYQRAVGEIQKDKMIHQQLLVVVDEFVKQFREKLELEEGDKIEDYKGDFDPMAEKFDFE